MFNFLSHLYPQTVATFHSAINGEIKVVRFCGSNRLVAGGLTQSGGLVTTLWRNALNQARKIHFNNVSPRQVLILGYGAGSAAQVVHGLWKGSTITGVDLDPMMIELGNKYLYNTPAPGVKVIIADAFKFMENNKAKHDLILVDLYLGSNFPEKLYTGNFINNIKKSLTMNGCAIFNVFALSKHQPRALEFIKLLEQTFLRVNRLHTISNWLIMVSN